MVAAAGTAPPLRQGCGKALGGAENDNFLCFDGYWRDRKLHHVRRTSPWPCDVGSPTMALPRACLHAMWMYMCEMRRIGKHVRDDTVYKVRQDLCDVNYICEHVSESRRRGKWGRL